MKPLLSNLGSKVRKNPLYLDEPVRISYPMTHETFREAQENLERTSLNELLIQVNRQVSFVEAKVNRFGQELQILQNHTAHSAVSDYLTVCAEEQGGLIQLSENYSSLPVLIDANGETIMVYQILEEIDCLIDLDALHETYPTLTYAQLGAVISFARAICQFNTGGIEIDALEEGELERDPSYQASIKEALNHTGENLVPTSV